MRKTARNAVLFSLGGGAYVGLELLYRGFSHVSMFFAGGLCFLLIGRLSRLSLPYLLRAACGAAAVTGVELTAGLLVNRQFQVWDYRSQPGNFLGQICPAFTAVWVLVTMLAMGLYRWAEGLLDRRFPAA